MFRNLYKLGHNAKITEDLQKYDRNLWTTSGNTSEHLKYFWTSIQISRNWWQTFENFYSSRKPCLEIAKHYMVLLENRETFYRVLLENLERLQGVIWKSRNILQGITWNFWNIWEGLPWKLRNTTGRYLKIEKHSFVASIMKHHV